MPQRGSLSVMLACAYSRIMPWFFSSISGLSERASRGRWASGTVCTGQRSPLAGFRVAIYTLLQAARIQSRDIEWFDASPETGTAVEHG